MVGFQAMVLWPFYLLRRAWYFLLGKRQFKVRVNTHPWAWSFPLDEPIELPGSDLEVTETFGMTEAGAMKFVAGLRDLFPEAAFTAASWQGEEPWDTRTFEIANATGTAETAFLTRLEQTQQDLLLTAQNAYLAHHSRG